MKKLIIVLLATSFSLPSFAQNTERSNLDLRVGIGSSLLGTGDMRAFILDTELNTKLNNIWTFAGGAAMGRSNAGVFETASFFQLNTNILLSPFKNAGKNDFRIGGGISWLTVSDAFISSTTFGPGGIITSQELDFDQRNGFGFNVVIENTYRISDKIMIGIKAFHQSYFIGDINTGILLKTGFIL